MIVKKLAFCLMLVSAVGCSTARKPNEFYLNGKKMVVSEAVIKSLRDRWVALNNKTIIASSLMDASDVQWSMDYISMIEMVRNKDCDAIELTKTRKFDIERDLDKTGAKIKPGLFDYIWEVKSCDEQRSYRLVNPKGGAGFALYPIN